MRAISLHVPDDAYQELKSVSATTDRPVAELIREAMTEYLERLRRSERSLREIRPHRSGAMRGDLDRAEIFEEMIAR